MKSSGSRLVCCFQIQVPKRLGVNQPPSNLKTSSLRRRSLHFKRASVLPSGPTGGGPAQSKTLMLVPPSDGSCRCASHQPEQIKRFRMPTAQEGKKTQLEIPDLIPHAPIGTSRSSLFASAPIQTAREEAITLTATVMPASTVRCVLSFICDIWLFLFLDGALMRHGGRLKSERKSCPPPCAILEVGRAHLEAKRVQWE